MPYVYNALLEAILSTAVDAIIVINEVGVIQTVNPATTKLFGYSESEMLGQNVKMLMPEPYRQEHDGYLKNYHDTGRAKIIGIGREVIGKRKDGTTFPMHLAVSEMRMGEHKMFAGIVRDISDLKQAQQQLTDINQQLEQRVQRRTIELRNAQAELLKAEKLATLGKVSGGIAHEIRNPLNALRTSTYYLRHAPQPPPEKLQEHLERIDRQVALIDSVVTALSDIARLPDPERKICRLDRLIAEVMPTVSLPANVTVVNQVAAETPAVLVDPDQLAIVFRNLIRNARDAMPDGGTLTLVASSTAGEVRIAVSDTGIGIESEDLRRIVEPLYSTKTRGMGLGLAICTTILDKNRGRLEVKSELGVGTTCEVHLPAVENLP